MLESLLVSYLISGICLSAGFILVMLYFFITDDPILWVLSQELTANSPAQHIANIIFILVALVIMWPLILLALYNLMENS